MSWLSKGLRKLGGVLNKAGGMANPQFGFLRDVAGGTDAKTAGAKFLENSRDAAKFYAAGASMGAGGGLAPLGGGGAAASTAGGGGWTGGLQKLGSWALDNPELIMSAASTVSGMDSQRKASRNEKKQLELIEQLWREREPLRRLGMDYMTREPKPLDLSVYRNAQNPYR